MTTPTPTNLQADTAGSALEISWSDHPTWKFPFHKLRDSCGCAHCIHEITGEKLLDPTTIPDDIHIQKMKLVGNYAVKISWSDGHDTGLYTWERLRELCNCSECMQANG